MLTSFSVPGVNVLVHPQFDISALVSFEALVVFMNIHIETLTTQDFSQKNANIVVEHCQSY